MGGGGGDGDAEDATLASLPWAFPGQSHGSRGSHGNRLWPCVFVRPLAEPCQAPSPRNGQLFGENSFFSFHEALLPDISLFSFFLSKTPRLRRGHDIPSLPRLTHFFSSSTCFKLKALRILTLSFTSHRAFLFIL